MEDIKDIKFVPDDFMPIDSNIKAIGVGGGGQNAVTYMYNQRIEGCTFIICNTDKQALENSNVPMKIQLGPGYGAGCDPIKARNYAIEAAETIDQKVLTPGTEMLFITAGMGGGTGTGASPIIASMARKKGILTVGVVTLPFRNNGHDVYSKAIDGIHELEKSVDSILIIDNEKLYQVYGDMLASKAYPMADEVLATAVRGIVEIIKKRGYINVDLEDVKTMMRDSGTAIMGIGIGTGEKRLEDAVKMALVSPLLNDVDLKTAQNMLVNVTCSKGEGGLYMNEMEKIDKLIESYIGTTHRFKKGLVYEEDENYGDKVSITIIATGFDMSSIGGISEDDLTELITTDYEYCPEEDTTAFIKGNIKIGPNDNRNEPRFNFAEAPVLCNFEGSNAEELERIPAIKRRH